MRDHQNKILSDYVEQFLSKFLIFIGYESEKIYVMIDQRTFTLQIIQREC